MDSPLSLSVRLTHPPTGSSPDVLATISLSSEPQGLTYTGDELTAPLTEEEEKNIRWYLEEYWRWPYEQFRERAEAVEELLPRLGKKMYDALFGSVGAQQVLQAWRLQPAMQRQISIVSDIPRVLSLPWELLHDEQGFLALRSRYPVSIVRRVSLTELPTISTAFEPPLRILLVTARPDDAGFVDPRGIARELLEAVADQVEQGSIALEFLRPPTLSALRERLADPKRPPVHILHFDGHGAFGKMPTPPDGLRFESGGTEQGMLAFEDEKGKEYLVSAEELAQVLQHSGIRLAVFTACQSAIGAGDDVFSSVATRLVKAGIDAVVAMSASVLVATATRYVAAFYRALAAGITVPIAQERARQALHADPRRHLSRRFQHEEGKPVELRDWWVPHYYQQRPVLFESAPATTLTPTKGRTTRKSAADSPLPTFSDTMPVEPRYGFSGRARELLQIERALLQKKLVVISGFGGMGKTALSREAADWFTRTRFYQRACFVSFESGGDAISLLSAIGTFLGIYDAQYDPNETRTALTKIQRATRKQPLLVIADNLETILFGGEAVLEPAERTRLWQVLLDLRKTGIGVLLTTRTTAFGDGQLAPGKNVLHLPLQGLSRDDAYVLATNLLTDLSIDRTRAPYEDLQALLDQLDYQPLAIQLVLPALRERSLSTICAEFATLLPTFVDDTDTGRNRSLLTSLEYSLRRLSEEQRKLLSRLAVFEGGASENNLLVISEIPEAEWATLRPALEQAALLIAEPMPGVNVPFLHFHPVLTPFLRRQAETEEMIALHQRYAQRYYALAEFFSEQDYQYPVPVRALVRRELPNLRRALDILLQEDRVDDATVMTDSIAKFLTVFGLTRERDQIRQRVAKAAAAPHPIEGERLTHAEYLREIGIAEDVRKKGQLRAASARLTALLTRIQLQPEGAEDGPGSFSHSRVLQELGCCLRDAGQLDAAAIKFREALSILDVLLKQDPKQHITCITHANMLGNLGTVLRIQGRYEQAQKVLEQVLQERRAVGDSRNEATALGELGSLARQQRKYGQARAYYLQALEQDRALGETKEQASDWDSLGIVAAEQHEWAEAERCFRESLALSERLGDIVTTAGACNNLALVAEGAGRHAEAEGWYRGALQRVERVEPGGMLHATCLSNLANLLVGEVSAGRVPKSRLVEARGYAEQARLIKEQPDISAEIWKTYGLLAQIAELEEQPEQARDYRRLERETFASFPGNRYQIDRQLADLIAAIVAATRGDAQARPEVEEVLPELERHGWRISTVMQRIWRGERDWHALVEDLDRANALLILRVLETLESPPGTQPSDDEEQTIEQLLTSLPTSIREALTQGDEAAFRQAFEGLTPEDQQAVAAVLERLQSRQKEEMNTQQERKDI